MTPLHLEDAYDEKMIAASQRFATEHPDEYQAIYEAVVPYSLRAHPPEPGGIVARSLALAVAEAIRKHKNGMTRSDWVRKQLAR